MSRACLPSSVRKGPIATASGWLIQRANVIRASPSTASTESTVYQEGVCAHVTQVSVANRGEIAVRASRAASELGAGTVAMFQYKDHSSGTSVEGRRGLPAR
nr:biotin carboxylase N-terminal domain-containing protein [Rhodococcus jostii]